MTETDPLLDKSDETDNDIAFVLEVDATLFKNTRLTKSQKLVEVNNDRYYLEENT